jgi:hypothetical protein
VPHKYSSLVAAAVCLAPAVLSSCSRGSSGSAEIDKPIPTVAGKRCVVHLHGKSGKGGPTTETGGVTHLSPTGNADGWGGRQWLYFPDSEYATVRSIVQGTIASAGCDKVVVHGFSNGAAAAAKLFCRGERFDGHAVGYVIDDPVVDHGVDGCNKDSGAKVKLYWTTGLSNAVDGWSCKEADWTCEGGTTIGIEKYAAALGVPATPSVNQKHEVYPTPPEYAEWLPQ